MSSKDTKQMVSKALHMCCCDRHNKPPAPVLSHDVDIRPLAPDRERRLVNSHNSHERVPFSGFKSAGWFPHPNITVRLGNYYGAPLVLSALHIRSAPWFKPRPPFSGAPYREWTAVPFTLLILRLVPIRSWIEARPLPVMLWLVQQQRSRLF
jgi:hypothetical protein